MHLSEHEHTTFPKTTTPSLPKPGLGTVEMVVFTRYEHGNLPVRVFQDPKSQLTNYEVSFPGHKRVFSSARSLLSTFYGHDVHMPFDRYFRLGKYRKTGRDSGAANILQLLDPTEEKSTSISIHGTSKPIRRTKISVGEFGNATKPLSKVPETPSDDFMKEFFDAMEGDLGPAEAFMAATPELSTQYEKELTKEFDRLEGIVGIKLTAKGKYAKNLALEVRKLLFAGFAGKMLSQGYDPEDVLQEVYGGILVRNKGKCPWDGRISTFGHYVHLVISCVLTNYHRRESRRKDTEPIPSPGDENSVVDVGQYGSCRIYNGSEIGDRMAGQSLADYLEQLPEGSPEAQLARQILPLVLQGYKRGEIARKVGEQPSVISKALAWLRREAALWATEVGLGKCVPAKFLCPA